MKNLKALFVVFLVSCFFACVANAQAIVEKDNTWNFAQNPDFPAVDHHQVLTPSGTVYYRASYKLPLTNEFIIQAIVGGKYVVEMTGWTKFEGKWYAFPAEVTFYPNGKVKVRGHYKMKPNPK